MDDQSVTGGPPYGSVDFYARVLRRVQGGGVEGYSIGVIALIAEDYYLGEKERLDRIQNVIAATERVATEPADLTGLAYSRTDDDPQPTAGREPLHTGAVTNEGLVDEEPF